MRFDQICVSILLEPYRGDANFIKLYISLVLEAVVPLIASSSSQCDKISFL